MNRELEPSHRDPLVIGVDVARFGDDMSVIFPRRGMDARSIAPLSFRGLPLDQLEDHVVAFCNAHLVSQIFVDGTGLGGGLVDHLRRRGYLVTDVQFAGKATEQINGVRYANQRCHIWGAMRQALNYLCLPANNQALREQICGPEYGFNKAGEIQLESKDLMRRRGVPSPDLADALACTFGGEISTLPELAPWVQPQSAVSEYDPFSPEVMRGESLPEAKTTARYYAPGWARMKKDLNSPGDWADSDAGPGEWQ
jgi:phage terminase large subunit